MRHCLLFIHFYVKKRTKRQMLQVEREGLGPAPCYILLWDRKIPHVGEHKNEARIDEKTCCHCSFVVVPVRD